MKEISQNLVPESAVGQPASEPTSGSESLELQIKDQLNLLPAIRLAMSQRKLEEILKLLPNRLYGLIADVSGNEQGDPARHFEPQEPVGIFRTEDQAIQYGLSILRSTFPETGVAAHVEGNTFSFYSHNGHRELQRKMTVRPVAKSELPRFYH